MFTDGRRLKLGRSVGLASACLCAFPRIVDPMSPLLLAALLAATPADTLPLPHGYLDALEAGTRSHTGAPGAAYWQQNNERLPYLAV